MLQRSDVERIVENIIYNNLRINVYDYGNSKEIELTLNDRVICTACLDDRSDSQEQ